MVFAVPSSLKPDVYAASVLTSSPAPAQVQAFRARLPQVLGS
jgi:hypothetical protein